MCFSLTYALRPWMYIHGHLKHRAAFLGYASKEESETVSSGQLPSI